MRTLTAARRQRIGQCDPIWYGGLHDEAEHIETQVGGPATVLDFRSTRIFVPLRAQERELRIMLRNLSSSIWGDQFIVSERPRTEGYQNAHLIPLHDFPDRDPRWGVYDSDGKLIEQAAYKRGPGRHLLGQSQTMEAELEFRKVDAVGIYGGLNLPYYGHYLLSTLSRYWYDLKRSYPGSKIYIHVMEGLSHWFHRPFVLQTMTVLGLTLDDFVAVDQPLQIRTLVVPGPAFIEQSQAHSIFGDTGRMIGEALIKKPVPARPEPVYLSKENLKTGIWKTTNESELVDEMRQAGVRIVHPENLELSEQVKIFAEHHTVLGFAGSGLHTCLLSGGSHRIIALCPLASVNSNFILLDRIKNNDSHYLGFSDGLLPASKLPGFGDVFEIPDVKKTAKKMLELAI